MPPLAAAQIARRSGSGVIWLLDTNILSEAARPLPDPWVEKALDASEGRIAVPAPALQELQFGYLRMAEGTSRQRVERFLKGAVALLPILPFDAAAARQQAVLRFDAERRGRPFSYPDSQIAAIALVHDLTLVTRNLRDFHDRPGLRCVNWFDSSAQPANQSPE